MPMTYRDAVRCIKRRGKKLLEHEKEHDTFTMPWGTKSAFRVIGVPCDRKFRAGLP